MLTRKITVTDCRDLDYIPELKDKAYVWNKKGELYTPGRSGSDLYGIFKTKEEVINRFSYPGFKTEIEFI